MQACVIMHNMIIEDDRKNHARSHVGPCYHQNLTESEVGRDQDRFEEYTWKKYEDRPLYAKYGLVGPCICNIVGYVSF
jgi:hypothetical protein